jgi:hypothetical protein
MKDIYNLVAAETRLDIIGCRLFRRAVKGIVDAAVGTHCSTGELLMGVKLQHYTACGNSL